MIIECGPISDRRTVEISLPEDSNHLGVFISGGIDSAILYYLLHLENRNQGFTHKIFPLIVLRDDGSKYFSRMVIDYVHRVIGIPKTEPFLAGDPYLPHDQQVRAGVMQAVYEYKISPVYAGAIEEIPEHYTGGWEVPVVFETSFFKAPLLNIQKPHVLDIVYQFGMEFLFRITHTCDTYEIGRCEGECRGCKSRRWAFEQIGRIDPGNI